MKTLDQQVSEFGEMRHDLQVMPKLAYAVCEAAERGEVDVDDATELFVRYYERAQSGGRNAKRKVDHTTPSVRVQASKLRQIIRAASVGLLDKVTKAHAEERGPRRALYHCMVDAARIYNELGRVPDKTLRAIVQRK